MTTAPNPAPAVHHAGCEKARKEGCVCECRGMMHQSDIIRAVLGTKAHPTNKLNQSLVNLFGSPFTTLSMNPGPNQRPRRDWQPIANASSQKTASQIEQRIVDVTLHDVLRIVGALPPTSKNGWLNLADDIMGRATWSAISAQIENVAGRHNANSGYFWASILAAAAGHMRSMNPKLTPTDIQTFINTSGSPFHESRYPRARRGNTVRTVREFGSAKAVSIAASVVSQAISKHGGVTPSNVLVTTVVGSAISADLWRHPVAVRYLLLPAIDELRNLTGSNIFSLDSTTHKVEDHIERHLSSKWRNLGAW